MEPKAFAEMLNVKTQSYYRYERGDRKCPDPVLELARLKSVSKPNPLVYPSDQERADRVKAPVGSIYKDTGAEEGEGLFGKTKVKKVAGTMLSVTEFEPKTTVQKDSIEPPLIPQQGILEPEHFHLVPLAAAHLSAGGGAFVLSERFRDFYAFRKDWLRRVATSPSNIVLMIVSGHSMEATIADGDIVMIDIGRTRVHDGFVYALGQGETIAIKRLENLPGDVLRVISDNKAEYPPYTAHMRDIRIIGQVIWFARELAPRA